MFKQSNLFKLITLCFLVQSALSACVCNSRGTLEEEFASAKAVYEGRALRKWKEGDDQMVRMSVSHAFKGEGKEIDIATPNNECKFGFGLGKKYVIFATTDENGKLMTTMCDSSQVSNDVIVDRLMRLRR
jgi:hypothetical protein